MRAKKVDNNHGEIREFLRAIPGVIVTDTSMFGNGFPDLLVKYKNNIYYVEVKKSSKEKLTPKEVIFQEFIGERYYIIVDQIDCLEMLNEVL